MNYSRRLLLLAAAIYMAALTGVPQARAHRVDVTARAEGRAIVGRALFADGHPVSQADVIVRDPTGRIVVRAKTDQQGQFHFTSTGPHDHLIVVDAGAGHAGKAAVKASARVGESKAVSSPTATTSAEAKAPSATDSRATGRQLERIQQQLMQLQQQLDQWERQTRFRDVLGGIGYIVGISGMLFYFLGARRNNRES